MRWLSKPYWPLSQCSKVSIECLLPPTNGSLGSLLAIAKRGWTFSPEDLVWESILLASSALNRPSFTKAASTGLSCSKPSPKAILVVFILSLPTLLLLCFSLPVLARIRKIFYWHIVIKMSYFRKLRCCSHYQWIQLYGVTTISCRDPIINVEKNNGLVYYQYVR